MSEPNKTPEIETTNNSPVIPEDVEVKTDEVITKTDDIEAAAEANAETEVEKAKIEAEKVPEAGDAFRSSVVEPYLTGDDLKKELAKKEQ